MSTFTYPASSDAAAESADIDLASEGVALGHGLLRSMLSWKTRAIESLAPVVAGVDTPDLSPVDPKALEYPGGFDPELLMQTLHGYSQKYAAQLSGSGLILRIDAQTPPMAFPVLAGTGDLQIHSGAASFFAGDYEDRDAFVRAIDEVRFGPEPSRQVSWLLNAALTRAAVQMAPYVFGMPRLAVNTAAGQCQVIFDHEGRGYPVTIEADSSPLSLHRQIRVALQRTWTRLLGREAFEVIKDFTGALAAQRLPAARILEIKAGIETMLTNDKAHKKMQHCSGAFISIRRIAAFTAYEVAAMDREAVRNALRHSTSGLNWRTYLTHMDRQLRDEIRACEEDGSLAFGLYSAESLGKMSRATENSAQAFGFTPTDVACAADFSLTFVRSLLRSTDPAVVQALKAVSPRYLATLMLGNFSERSLAREHLRKLSNPQQAQATAVVAGYRLGQALSASFREGAKNILPWARVLTSEQAYEFLLSPDKDDAKLVRCLTNLILTANHLRAKGKRAEAISTLPPAEEFLAAPSDADASTFLNLYGPEAGQAVKVGARGSFRLVAEILEGMRPLQTLVEGEAGSTTMSWAPGFAAVWRWHETDEDLRAGFDVALSVGTGRRQLWSTAQVHARLVDDSATVASLQESTSDLCVEVRGADTPEKVRPLILQVGMQERFRKLTSSPGTCRMQLGLHPLTPGGTTTPYLQVYKRTTEQPPLAFAHGDELPKVLASAVATTFARKPYHSAAAFPAVAKFLWQGGKLADGQVLRPLGAATAWKLARACLGSENPHGMGLLLRQVRRPDTLSSSGASLIDLALESTKVRLGLAALHGLEKNPHLSAEAKAELVQRSMGKLVERHPLLLDHALRLGARMTEDLLSAWRRVHPLRRSPALDALAQGAAMEARIDQAADMTRAAPVARRPRRSL